MVNKNGYGFEGPWTNAEVTKVGVDIQTNLTYFKPYDRFFNSKSPRGDYLYIHILTQSVNILTQ